MRKTLLVCAVLFAFPMTAAAQTLVEDEQWTGNVSLFIGGKALDESDWAPVDGQGQIGIEADFRPVSFPISFAADLMFSADSRDAFDSTLGWITITGDTFELDLGVRKYWELDPMGGLFAGGGLAIGGGDFEYDVVSDSGSGAGFWFDFGGYARFNEVFNLGLEFRYSSIPVTIFDIDVDAGGVQLGILLGYHF